MFCRGKPFAQGHASTFFIRYGAEVSMGADCLWYALRLRSNFEHKAARVLASKGYEVFLPAYEARQQWADRTKKVQIPLFPGYLFCRFDGTQKLPILMSPGVVDIVGFGSSLAPIPEGEINAVRTLLESHLEVRPCPFLKIGERVIIEAGPLAGVSGVLLDFKNSYRLLVSIDLIQRSVSAEIQRDWVRRDIAPPNRLRN